MDSREAELRSLRACVRDLTALSALPLVWVEYETADVVGGFLDTLVGSLRLDLAYARITESLEAPAIEAARASGRPELAQRAQELGRALAPMLGSAAVATVPDPLQRGTLRIRVLPLGLGEQGAVVAGSRRADFPTDFDTALLGAAVNQLTIWLRARRLLLERSHAETALANSERERRELEEQSRRLRQAAKMEAIGRVAAAIAHDFNNILGAILGHGDLAQLKISKHSPVRRHVDEAMRAAARGKGLVERILAFSRREQNARAPVQVQAVVEEALALLGPSAGQEVRLEQVLDAADAAVIGDATQLHQAVMNLCTNAIHAIEQRGVVTVRLARARVDRHLALSHGTLAMGDYVRLAVSDTGAGIAPAALERLFEPFFTTKGSGKGTGLGLSLVHAIVADLGGAIDVATEVGLGTTFAIWLPAASDAPAPLAAPLAAPPPGLPRGEGEAVMVVDDDPVLVELAEEMLVELGYRPTGFRSSVAALEILRAEPRRFEVVLIDELMPQLSGTGLAAEIRQLRPDLPILLMSGYSGGDLMQRAGLAGVDAVLRKPLVRGDIAEPIARARGGQPRAPAP
jgi:signal transduction histidine kinase/ActR/RegA family two-component response regulator